MFNAFGKSNKSALPKLRRADLRALIKETYPDLKKAVVMLVAGFEPERVPFRQESSFFYLTGITEPGVILLMDLAGKTTLYIAGCENRAAWLKSDLDAIQANPKAWGIDEVKCLGKALTSYQIHPFTPATAYDDFIAQMSAFNDQGYSVLTLNPQSPHEYVEQRLFLQRFLQWVPGLTDRIQDISPLVADMRRSKDMGEIESIYNAIEITTLAQQAAASMIAPKISEAEVQATIEYMMIGSFARPAFSSIVGGGANSTILHYHANNQTLNAGDVVVIDIGAESDYYAADITRTYPVSGVFSARQKEIYTMVLDTQFYIADIAKPGMWLKNKDNPAQSLHHRAVEFLEKKGYAKYFPHGIGHYLGLDVHDVGDYAKPLDEGDVFTIEPGIYIPEEKIGIRIEDDYWMTKDGVVCLSEELPKRPDDVEEMMRQKHRDHEEPNSCCDDEHTIAQG